MAARIYATLVLIAFVIAEARAPTRLHEKRSSGALISAARSGDATAGRVYLDADLLNDLPRIDALPFGNVDSVSSSGRPLSSSGTKLDFTVATHAEIRVVGWFADSLARAPGAALFPIVDGRRLGDADIKYGLKRPDVARVFGVPSMIATGFELRLPPGSFHRGRHRVAFGLVSGDRRGYFLAPQSVTLSDLH